MARRTLFDVILQLLFRTCRRWYLVIVPVASFAVTWGLLVIPGLLIMGTIVDLPTAVTLEMTGALAASSAIALTLATVTTPRSIREPISRQLRHDDVDPRLVWLAATDASVGWTVRTVLYGMPASSIAMTAIAWRHDVLSPIGWVGMSTFVAVGTVMMTSLWFAAGRILIQPVVDEAVRIAPDVATTTQRRSTQLSILIAVASFTFLGLTVGAATAEFVDDPNLRFAALTAASILSAGWAVFIAYELITHPLLAPLDALTTAARRIGAGSFDQPLYPSSADEFGDVMIAFNEMQQGLRERERLREAFGSYVDVGLAERIVAAESPMFAGEEVDVTVLFLDVRDFTSFASNVTARAALERLNLLFEAVVPIVRAHGGHANKFLGDGLLATFGAPEPLEDHADRALAAAAEIATLVRRELGDKLRVGIGLSSGQVIAGTVGGGGKLEFTLIGDAVNVASRVEELTKVTGDAVLFTDATRRRATLREDQLVDRGEHQLRGTDRSIRVHSLVLEDDPT